MRKLISAIKNKYLNESLDFRAQIFNLLAMIGMALGVIVAASCIATNAGIINITVNLALSGLAFALLEYTRRTGRYKRSYYITVVSVFVVAFPVLFFAGGGYRGGMPAFFIFAIVFTVFMLEGKGMYIMTALEVVLYVGVCLIAYHYPGTVSLFETVQDMEKDIIIGFTASSAALGIAVFWHIRIYDKKQEQLIKANAELEQVDRMKTEFLGNISHELKTPLTVISGYAQTARRILEQSGAADSAAASDKMKLISSEAERLALMVGQILDATRIEEGRMLIEKAPCNADEVIHAAINTHYPILNKNANQLDIRIDDGLPEILGDPARISQVIVNLISNAVRFTANGRITVSAKPEGDFVEISVADTGAGIDPERLPFIFERYNQRSGAGQDTGTGLGLYICKYIVEAHGGRITVDSARGQGADVRFTIPAARALSSEPC